MLDERTKKIRFDGQIPCKDGTTSRFSVAASFRENDFTDLNLEIFWHGDAAERRKAVAAFMANKMNHVWIPNENPADGHVELLGLRGYSTQYFQQGAVSMQPLFSAMQKGIHRDVEKEDRKLYFVGRFVPSGLAGSAINEHSYTGEAKVKPLVDHGAIVVKTTFGELKVGETYNWETVDEYADEITKRIPQSTVSGEIVLPKGKSLYDVNEALFEELELLETTLAFCYRQPLRFVHLTYQDLADRQRAQAFYRKKLPAPMRKLKGENFINERNLTDGGLQRLMDGIRRVEGSADLIRAIGFLVASYDNNVETAFFMSFSAMETVVSLAAPQPGESEAAKANWKLIQEAMKEAIQVNVDEAHFDRKELFAKLREFSRPSFRRRVTFACAKFNPVTSDIWPDGGFLEGIGEAASIRNGLFHSAQYSDAWAISEALVRTRTFTERLIAKIVGWPDDQLWVWRDSDLRFLNQQDRTVENPVEIPARPQPPRT